MGLTLALTVEIFFFSFSFAQEYKGLSWIEVCCRAVAALQRQHVIQSETDEASVIFYSTVRALCVFGPIAGQLEANWAKKLGRCLSRRRAAAGPSSNLPCSLQQETKSESGVLGGVFVQQALDGFDVLRIKEMETFTRAQFEQDVGSASESAMEPGLGLKNALWAAAIAFDSRPGNTAKTVIVFTRDEEPAKPNSQARCERGESRQCSVLQERHRPSIAGASCASGLRTSTAQRDSFAKVLARFFCAGRPLLATWRNSHPKGLPSGCTPSLQISLNFRSNDFGRSI